MSEHYENTSSTTLQLDLSLPEKNQVTLYLKNTSQEVINKLKYVVRRKKKELFPIIVSRHLVHNIPNSNSLHEEILESYQDVEELLVDLQEGSDS